LASRNHGLVIPANAEIRPVIPANAEIQPVIPANAEIRPVIPANAGIQEFTQKPWIPAFAGMTTCFFIVRATLITGSAD